MKKKYLKYFKNKYILASTLFAVYFLFLDDNDIFVMVQKNRVLTESRHKVNFNNNELKEIKLELAAVNNLKELERIAREEKLFKKDNEVVFVVVRR